MFAKDLTGCFSHCCAEGGDHSVHVCFFITHDGERCKLPTYHSFEGFRYTWGFQLYEAKLESCVLACWFFPDEGERSSSASHVHFQCLLLENFQFWQCSLLMRSASSLECNQLVVVLSIWAVPGPSSGCFMITNVYMDTKSLKLAKSRSLNSLSFVWSGPARKPECRPYRWRKRVSLKNPPSAWYG